MSDTIIDVSTSILITLVKSAMTKRKARYKSHLLFITCTNQQFNLNNNLNTSSLSKKILKST